MAARRLHLEVVTPERRVVLEDVDEVVTIPGTLGAFGVLPGHTRFMTTLKPGPLLYRVGEASHLLVVSWGYAEVDPRHVSILAEAAERAEEIDVERARQAKQRAEERLARGGEGIDLARARAALARAEARLAVAERFRSRGT